MARRKKADPDTAMQAAVALFWKNGFHATGTRQIERDTGITRFTLQTTYGGKKALYLAALDHYLNLVEAEILAPLDAGTLDAIATWFEQASLPDDLKSAGYKGCLMTHAITEFGDLDTDVTLRAEWYYTMLRQKFSTALNTARKTGDMPIEVHVATAVELLVANTIAIHVADRSAARNAGADTLRRAAGQMVRSWSDPV